MIAYHRSFSHYAWLMRWVKKRRTRNHMRRRNTIWDYHHISGDQCYSKRRKQVCTYHCIMLIADDKCWLGINCSHAVEQTRHSFPDTLAARNLINEAKTEEYKERWYIVDRMQIPWNKARDKRRHQSKKKESKCTYKQNWIPNKRQKNKNRNKDQSAQRIRGQHLPVQQQSMDCQQGYSNDVIDSLHRRLLQNAVHICYPKIITKIHLNGKTEDRPWSKVIRQRRLSLLGHVFRLPEEIPVRVVLKEYCRSTSKSRGAPKITWEQIK